MSSEGRGGGWGGGCEQTFYWDPKWVPHRPKNWYASWQFPRACGGFLRPDLLRPPSEHRAPGDSPHPRWPGALNAKRGRHLPDSPIYGSSGAHQLEVFTNSSLNEYLNALSKNFSGQHIDVFFSEKQDLTQTGGSPPGMDVGVKNSTQPPGFKVPWTGIC